LPRPTIQQQPIEEPVQIEVVDTVEVA